MYLLINTPRVPAANVRRQSWATTEQQLSSLPERRPPGNNCVFLIFFRQEVTDTRRLGSPSSLRVVIGRGIDLRSGIHPHIYSIEILYNIKTIRLWSMAHVLTHSGVLFDLTFSSTCGFRRCHPSRSQVGDTQWPDHRVLSYLFPMPSNPFPILFTI